MATVPKEAPKLTFVEIVMNADAEVIRAAYEARVEVDKLLAQREEAYRRIAELEAGVDQILGEAGLFVFPPPPLPVAAADAAAARARRPGKAAARTASPAPDSTAADADAAAEPDDSAVTTPAGDADADAADADETPGKASAGRPDGADRATPRGGAAAHRGPGPA